MNKDSIHPPRWANKFLEWYCKAELLEDLQGDLHEYFDRNLENKGKRKARLRYVIDVLKFFKPYTVKKLEILDQITHFVMFKNYFKTSLRSIGRNRLFSAINVFGLAISMSICLIMITMFMEVKTYDQFHADAARIYRLNNYYQFLEEDKSRFASTSILAGKRFIEEVPGTEAVTILRNGFGGDAKVGDRTLAIGGLWANDGFFDVFSFQMLRGNPQEALTDPYSIVLTDETAEKIFKGQDPMDQTIMFDDEQYKVTGIVKKPPFNSHIKFEALGSFITYEKQRKEDPEDDDYWISWNNMWSNYVYFKLDENAKLSQIQAGLDRIAEDENAKSDRVTITTGTEAMLSIMLGPSDMSNQIGESIGGDAFWIFGALVFIVILSAGFNYTNLSIARSLRRAKEVGVRKVVGATRGQVFSQFIVEACIISLCALGLAIFIFFLIKPMFLNLAPEIQQTLRLDFRPELIIYFVLFAIVVGIFAGLFPSMFLSKLRAIQVLKDSGSTKLFSRINMRKVLIVFQFTLSLAFIVSSAIGHRQFKYAMAFDLGFTTENILNVNLEGNEPDQVKAIFERIPEVNTISSSSLILSTGSRWGSRIKYEDKTDSTTLYYAFIDENYIPLLKHELIAGSNFESKPQQEKEEGIILNEFTLKRFNIGTPQEAIGKYIELNEENIMIIGVVKDFHYAKISSEIECFGFRYSPDQVYWLNLGITTTDLVATRDKIEAAWNEFDDVHEFNASFYDDRIQQSYKQMSLLAIVIGFLAFLTITISAMGLLGMGVYTAETRLKEISIRKVLGATEGNLVKHLSMGFVWLLIIASFIALPLTYVLFDSVILVDVANRAEIGIFEMLLGVILIFGIGFLTIGSQTWKAAKSNPASTLRNE